MITEKVKDHVATAGQIIEVMNEKVTKEVEDSAITILEQDGICLLYTSDAADE